jgi:hypothetical protein
MQEVMGEVFGFAAAQPAVAQAENADTSREYVGIPRYSYDL